jgi:hypothetical protein
VHMQGSNKDSTLEVPRDHRESIYESFIQCYEINKERKEVIITGRKRKKSSKIKLRSKYNGPDIELKYVYNLIFFNSPYIYNKII